MSCHIYILFIWQVQDIDKEYEKLEKLLKKLQVWNLLFWQIASTFNCVVVQC